MKCSPRYNSTAALVVTKESRALYEYMSLQGLPYRRVNLMLVSYACHVVSLAASVCTTAGDPLQIAAVVCVPEPRAA